MSRQYRNQTRDKNGALLAEPNPLSKFATYSYHQILVMCDSSETAVALYSIDSSKISGLYDVDPTIGDPSPKTNTSTGRFNFVKQIPTKSGIGQYVTIANSLSSARYSINEVSWTTTIGETSSNNDISFATSLSEEGKLEIHELTGVSFYSTIGLVSKVFKSDPSNIVFLLKTLFIGNPDHTSDTVDVFNVRPLLFTMTDLTSTFGIDGSKHEITFVGNRNGFAQSPQLAGIGADTRIQIPKTNTSLKAGLTILQDSLNARYVAYLRRVEKLHIDNGCPFNIDSFKKIRYEIRTSEDYENDPGYMIDIFDDWVSTDATNIIINFGTDATVESCIDYIMLRSKKVSADEDEFNNRRIHKIFSEVTSNNKEIIVTYEVLRQTEFYEKENPPEAELDDIKSKSIEFDYIFTGKNTDIEENGIDLKLDVGNSYLRFLSTHGSIPKNIGVINPLESVVPSLIPVGSLNNQSNNPDETINQTLFFGGISMDNMSRNTGDRAVTTLSRTFLSNYAAISNIAASLTINGNPNLIMGPAIGNIEELNLSNHDRLYNIPIWCKINVKYPDHNYPEDNYALLDFWYTGYYRILEISHVFSGGLFKQTLNLVSQPVATFQMDDKGKKICSFDSFSNEAITNLPPEAQSVGATGSWGPEIPKNNTGGATGGWGPQDDKPRTLNELKNIPGGLVSVVSAAANTVVNEFKKLQTEGEEFNKLKPADTKVKPEGDF